MNFILLAVLKNIRKWLSCKKSQNNKYQELLECEIPTTDTELDLKEQAKQIQWIKDNVKFYPASRTTVYHEGSANDILKACHKYKLNYQEAPRVFQTAMRWNISYLDMAEMMSNFDRAQTSS